MNHDKIDPFITQRLYESGAEFPLNETNNFIVRVLPKGLRLSPEERLSLFRILSKYRLEGSNSIEWSVHQIAKLSDSNIATTSCLLKKLKQFELIIPNIIGSTSHRSRDPYILTTDFIHLIRPIQPSFIVSKLQPLEYKLLFPAKGFNPSQKNRGGLSRSNRWLLCVLLEFANDFGVVDCLSDSLLMSLTGMTEKRLKSELNYLKCLGFIHCVTPSSNNQDLLGYQLPVVYLNLMHPYYENCRMKGFTTLITKHQHCSIIKRGNDSDRSTVIKKRTVLKKGSYESYFESTLKLLVSKNSPLLMGTKSDDANLFFLDCLFARIITEMLYDVSKFNLNDFNLHNSNVCKAIPSVQSMFNEAGLNIVHRPIDSNDYIPKLSICINYARRVTKEIYRRLSAFFCDNGIDRSMFDFVVLPVGGYIKEHKLALMIVALQKDQYCKGIVDFMVVEQIANRSGYTYLCHDEWTASLRYKYRLIDDEMKKKICYQLDKSVIKLDQLEYYLCDFTRSSDLK